MAAVKLQPLSPEKEGSWSESWEHVPSVVRGALKTASTNMASLKRWAERQEMELRLESERREELLRRLDATDRRIRQVHTEESAEMKAKLAAIELRVERAEERAETAGESLRQWSERSFERAAAKVEEVRNEAADHQKQAMRAAELASASAGEALEKAKVAARECLGEADVKMAHMSAKQSALQTELHELRSSLESRAKEALHHADRLASTLEERVTRIHETSDRLERDLTDLRQDSGQRLEDTEQQILKRLEDFRTSERSRADKLGFQLEQLSGAIQEQQQTLESETREAANRLAKVEQRTKDRSDALALEADGRAQRLGDALDDLKRHVGEQFEQARSRNADLQKSLETTLREQGIWLGDRAKETAEDALQRANQHSADATNLLRQKVEDQVDRLTSFVKDVDAKLGHQISDAQTEWRTQMDAERRSVRLLIEESTRNAETKIRETEAALNDMREAGDGHLKEQVEEARLTLRREFADGDERMESVWNNALRREAELLRKAIEEVQHGAATALAHHTELLERQFKKQSEASLVALQQSKLHTAELAEELRTKMTSHTDQNWNQLQELRDRVSVTEKDLKLTADELPSFWRRWEGARQADVAAIEELRWAMQDGTSKLDRRIQVETESVQELAKQMATVEESMKQRLKDVEYQVNTKDVSIHKDHATLQMEIAQVQATMADANQVNKARCERQARDLQEMSHRHKELATDCAKRLEDLDKECSSARILSLFGEHVEGMARSVVSRELHAFQREALDSMEWRLDRCVQWLHGANVKLGLNPHGTLFSLDRFKEEMFAGSPKVRGRRRAASQNPH